MRWVAVVALRKRTSRTCGSVRINPRRKAFIEHNGRKTVMAPCADEMRARLIAMWFGGLDWFVGGLCVRAWQSISAASRDLVGAGWRARGRHVGAQPADAAHASSMPSVVSAGRWRRLLPSAVRPAMLLLLVAPQA